MRGRQERHATQRAVFVALGWSALIMGLANCAPSDGRRSDRVPASIAAVRDSEVEVPADSGRMLAGTYARPTGAATRHPAVLLLSGSGPQNRDGARPELPGYLPLRELADSLGRRGFAVLRLDDRGVGGSTGSFAGATTRDFARDAAHAVAWLRDRADVDPSRIALVGHSEGALVAMLVASLDRSIDALVLLGAAARPGRDVARWQRAALVAGDQSTWPADARTAVLAAADSNAERAAAHDPWLREWFALDPRAVARTLRVPVLILHGATDRQVPVTQADELAASLRSDGSVEVSVLRFPSTNHLFLEDRDGDPRGYARLPRRGLRGDVAHAVAGWLSRRTRR